jgi:hypothetical protein
MPDLPLSSTNRALIIGRKSVKYWFQQAGSERSGVFGMTIATFAPAGAFAPSSQPVAIPVGEVLPWAIFGGLVLMIALYFVGAEQGATSLFQGMYVHEFVHDGRHLLGFPCH